MKFSRYSISSKWSKDSRTTRWIAEAFLETLERLGPLSPSMRNWTVRDSPVFHPRAAPTSASEMEALVAGSLEWKYPDGPDDPVYGYTVQCRGSRVPSDVGQPDTVDFRITAGGLVENEIEFEVGSPIRSKDFSVITYPVYRGAVEAFASAWPCPWAFARASDADVPPVDAPRPWKPALFEVAWIGYLSAPLAAGLAPPRDLISEPTPGGGLILSAVRTLIDRSNPDHMRRSRQLEAIMMQRVGLSEYGRPNAPAARDGVY
jgi:hypothetical protein